MANGSAVVFFILRAQPDVAFEFLTDAVESQIGCPAAEGLADPAAVLGLVDPEYSDQLTMLLGLTPGNQTTSEMTWRHRDGRPVHAQAWVRSRRREDGSVILEGSIRDVTRLHEAESELRLSEQRHRLPAENRRLHDSLQRTDAVARWGGEEFVVLLRGCHTDEAVATAEKIRARIADSPFDDAGRAAVSIGAAELAAEDDLDSWLARADEALYKAKRSGRNAVRA